MGMPFVVAVVLAGSIAGADGQVAPPPAAEAAPQAPAPAPQAAPAPPPARVFTAPAGLIFNAVRPERVADFEVVLAYLQAALQTATDPTIREQARGWRVYKATEPGPNGTVLYVFDIDPAVPGVEYGLGRVLADAYPDPAQLQQIWKLYTGAVTSGGTLLNLAPVAPVTALPDLNKPPPRALPTSAPPPQPGTAPAPAPPPADPAVPAPPADSDPLRRP